MKYQSTRGEIRDWTFEQVLFSGYLPDGGLALPQRIPTLQVSEIKSWAKLSYLELVKKILPYFIGDEIPASDLNALLDKAFKRFTCPEVIKLARLSEDLNILELFHGPTLAFKDLALSVVGQLFQYILSRRKKHVILVIATAGDTGSAVIEAVRGLEWVDVIVLLPRGRVSRVQELQMTTVIEDNVHVFRGDATTDDLDQPVKAVFTDLEFSSNHNLCSMNSINWARLMVQIAQYFYAYFQLCPDVSGEVEMVVPTGGCGNVAAGLVAVEMGLPVKFVSVVTPNDVVARTINHGDYTVTKEIVPTMACALDTTCPYNIERILCLLSGMDTSLVNDIVKRFETTRHSAIPKKLLEKLQSKVKGYTVGNEGIRSAMVQCWQKNQYLVCPHTAVAVKYHYDTMKDKHLPRVCVATASPAKFEEAVTSAGLSPQPTEAIRKLDAMETRYVDIEKDEDFEQILRNKIIEISENRRKVNLLA